MNDREELVNVLTHLLGFAAGLVAIPVLMWYLIFNGKTDLLLSCGIYGTSYFIIYFSSVAYHCTIKTSLGRMWRRLDHCGIYIYIAGTYTPFLVQFFPGNLRIATLAFVWGIAFLGIARKILLRELKDYSLISISSYVLLGWFMLFIFRYVLEYMPGGCIASILAGGLAYTVGIIFYMNDRKPYFHCIWHLFVLLGSSIHYWAILKYIA